MLRSAFRWPTMPITIALAQIDVAFADRERNLARMISVLEETAGKGAKLTVFPEAALTGYCYDSLEEARPHAEPIPGPSTRRLADVCRKLGCHVVYGLLEDDGTERVCQTIEAGLATAARQNLGEQAKVAFRIDRATGAVSATHSGQPLERADIERFMVQVDRGAIVEAIRRSERETGGRIFNATALVGPQGVVGSYRKVHLPFLGVDRFTTPGDRPFAVHEAAGMRIGMHICYDGGFPEPARVLTLLGADLLVLPTNWPPGAQCMAGCAVNTRAMENNVYYAACDRVGDERGFHFIGQSKICDPAGRVLAEAAHDCEAILYAEIDVAKARQKKIVRRPKLHEIDRIRDRRPEMYGEIVRPK